MPAFVIRGAVAMTPARPIEHSVITVEHGRITGVGDDDSMPTSGVESVLDARGLTVIPGLIDLQCNGIAGLDVLDCDERTVQDIADAMPRFGCTGVLPTLISSPREQMMRFVQAIAAVTSRQQHGATILGAHLEGPWLHPAFHGAHRVECLRPFSQDEWISLLEAAAGTIRLVTLAPDAPGNHDAVRRIATAGAIASIGHSSATYSQALEAVAQGAAMVTHLFNAMSPLHHHNPTLANAALDRAELTFGLIPDGHHVHASMIRLVSRAVPGKVVVVTDSVPSAALPPGHYTWNERAVSWDGETVRLDQGGLAGSGLTPLEALKRYMAHTGLTLHQALPAMTSLPASMLGLAGERGSIVAGARADLALLRPDLSLHSTYVHGKLAFQA